MRRVPSHEVGCTAEDASGLAAAEISPKRAQALTGLMLVMTHAQHLDELEHALLVTDDRATLRSLALALAGLARSLCTAQEIERTYYLDRERVLQDALRQALRRLVLRTPEFTEAADVFQMAADAGL